MFVALVKFVLFIIKTALKVVYNVLKLFKIRLLALWLIASGIMALSGVYARIGIEWFWIGVGLCVASTIIAWLIAAGDASARKKLKRERKELAEEESSAQAARESEQRETRTEKREKPVKYPRWYDVQGRPNYFFAEYADRYELFYRGQNGAVHVRTDYKEKDGESNG